MSERNFRIGQSVQIVGKNVSGRIAYIGTTNFSTGKWIGVVLEEDRGKNNGTVKGVTYFKCPSQRGLFVRPSQLSTNIMPQHSEANLSPIIQTSIGLTAFTKQTTATATVIATATAAVATTAMPSNIDDSTKSTIINTSTVSSSASSHNLLKTTKISQPKQPKQFLSSMSQLCLQSAAEGLITIANTTTINTSTNNNSNSNSNSNTNTNTKTNINNTHNATTITAASTTTTNTITTTVIHPTINVTNAALALAPKRSKTSVSPSESFCCVKRASFIETGFLEILRPQFTPGNPLRSPTYSLSTLSSVGAHSGGTNGFGFIVEQQQRELKCKQLENRVIDLTEEVDSLRRQRAEDKRRLHELERLRLQHDQLVEFKVKIMEQHGLLQRDLQRQRQELREANESRGKAKRELDELLESIELLTLDKEMAEERAETLQLDLDIAQERIEELTLDLEIVRAENEEFGSGNQSNDQGNGKSEGKMPSVGEVLKLEQYNHRLRETVVRLRDALTHEKQELQRARKELDTKYSEIMELQKTKELLSQRVDVLEIHIFDLKEQVDAALGAETMVESLADIKLELEERVKLLEEEVAELEALEEIHEQLIESNQELEMDLRDEVNLLNNNIRQLQQEKDDALENLYDRDTTILKFRELVRSLNEQLQTRDTTAGTASTSDDFSTISNQEESQSIDFNQMFTVTKAYGRALDAQLAKVELKLSKLHIEYLLPFVPEEFLLRCGEYDVILVLLLLHRITEKVEMICNAIHEKFPSSCELGKDAIFEGISLGRFIFRSKSLFHLRSLKLVLQQFVFSLNNCDYEVCTHVAIYRGEIESQEKQVDELLRLLRTGLLDENTPIETIERSVNFFNGLHANLILSLDLTELVDQHQLYASLLESYEVGLDCVNVNAGLLHTIIQLGDENTESFWAMQYLTEHTGNFKQRLKKLHRRFTGSGLAAYNGIGRDRIARLQLTTEYFGKLINVLVATAREATKDIYSNKQDDGNADTTIEHERLWKILTVNCLKMGPDDHQTPLPFFQQCMEMLEEQLTACVGFVEENENVRNTNINTVFVRSSASALLQRATQVKQHFEEMKIMERTLTVRDKEIKTLKYMAKLKQSDYSEMQIRKEMAERNLTRALSEQEQAITHIAEYIENVENLLRDRDAAILASFTTLQRKLTTLEVTLLQCQRSLQDNSKTVNSTTHESLREIHLLNERLRVERRERTRLQCQHLERSIRSFTPLKVPKSNVPQATTKHIAQLEAELKQLKKDWLLSYITLQPNIESSTERRRLIQHKSDSLCRLVIDTYLQTNPHLAVPSNFGFFGSSDMRQMLSKILPINDMYTSASKHNLQEASVP